MTETKSDLQEAWVLLFRGEFAAARDRAARLLESSPDNVSALVCHAMACWQADGDIAGPEAEMQRALQLAPNDPTVRHNYANILASRGEMAGAVAQYEAALRLKPDDTLAFYGLTQNQKFRETTPLVSAMQQLYRDNAIGPERREFLAFGLAKVASDLGQAEAAMGYAIEANRLGARPFDAAGETRAVAELQALVRQDAFRTTRSSGHPESRLVFIVGMNRSGTTLVESILSRHPLVAALGERLDMFDLESAMLAQKRLPVAARHAAALSLSRDWFKVQAEAHVKRLNALGGPPARVITDKLPENAVRLGLIARLFPKARIIYTRRHPLDVGLSNFFQRFSQGQGFSTRLDWVGLRTRQLAETMVLWKEGLDLPILDVSYEQLVADPETETRRIVDFAGLDWDPACLEPSQTPRGVLTASQWQVRQPINRASVDRWRPYEPWLGPMIAAMGGMAWIEKELADIQASVASRWTNRS